MIIHTYDPSRPPVEKGNTRSIMLLCFIETPSAGFWAIGYYDTQYKKECPWRDIYNHSLRGVIYYCDLPETPNSTGREKAGN